MMKENSWAAYLLYLPISVINAIARLLPIKTVLGIGAGIGSALYYIHIKRRRIALNNLKAAFGSELKDLERKAIVKKIYRNFGLNIMELFLMPRMNDAYFSKYTKVTNLNRVEEALKQGNGLLYLSAHYGNWELCASISAYYGYKMHALARVQKPYFLNDLLNHNREIRGTKVIQKGMQIREILKNLKENGIVGMIGDQSGRLGIKIDFFGRPVFMADGTFRIAAKTGAPILPAFNIRHGDWFKHELRIEEPIRIAPGEDTEEFIKRGLSSYRSLLEKYIRKYPYLWLWGNRRWKYTSARTVVILDDGKTGHLRQAQAVAHSIEAQTSPVKIVELKLAYKSKIMERLLKFIVFIRADILFSPMLILKTVLKPEFFEKLEDLYSDIIICTGSSTRAVALLSAKENLSKTISIMKPSPFSTNRFNLSIIPYHDRPRLSKNVLLTHGALNMVSKDSLVKAKEELSRQVKIKEGFKIGVLIGGDSRYYTLDADTAQRTIKALKLFCDKYNAWLLLSTSRRTPEHIDRYIKKSLEGYPRCIFKVFPNEENFNFAVNGILAVSQAVIVTAESISMVSEAASSEVYPIVVGLKKNFRNKISRHELFLRHLSRAKIIRYAAAEDIYKELVRFKENRPILRKLDDRKKLDRVIKDKIIK